MSLLANVVVVRSSEQERRTFPASMYLVAFCAWTNPLMLIYLLAGVSPRLFRVRCALGGVILLCLIGSVIFLATTRSVPLIGYFLWITGILSVFYPDADAAASTLRFASAPE
jgi:hypothetical protein